MKGGKQDMRLRRWVKVAIAIIITITIMMLFNIVEKDTEKAIENCVEAGNSRTYCERSLRA